MTTANAPGKIILLGEHAVVYGRPAIAVPIKEVRATADVEDARAGAGCTIVAADLGRTIHLAEAAEDDPLAAIVRGTLGSLKVPEPDVTITIHSTIPIASGMGSGAAVSAAVARGLAAHLGHPFDNGTLSWLVFEVEKLHHGTPSGIDNTVVAQGQPVFFVKDRLIQNFTIKSPLYILIADTGIPSSTKAVVQDVRTAWEADRERYDNLFKSIGQVVIMGRAAIETGEFFALGALMDGNQWLLQQMGVSSPEINRLVQVARRAGALGAKLSGGGRGGNIIALVAEDKQEAVADALRQAAAKNVIATIVA
jgi:mevalonate kinase